ncbi:MAG: hypothetical protein ACYC21_11025 [Eubacteriales bacterium]
MKNLTDFIEPEIKKSIEDTHLKQADLYGVYVPPSLKQLVSLRHLLIRTASLENVNPEELRGLSKTECSMLLKKLNTMYAEQRRKSRPPGKAWQKVEPVEEVGR